MKRVILTVALFVATSGSILNAGIAYEEKAYPIDCDEFATDCTSSYENTYGCMTTKEYTAMYDQYYRICSSFS